MMKIFISGQFDSHSELEQLLIFDINNVPFPVEIDKYEFGYDVKEIIITFRCISQMQYRPEIVRYSRKESSFSMDYIINYKEFVKKSSKSKRDQLISHLEYDFVKHLNRYRKRLIDFDIDCFLQAWESWIKTIKNEY